MFSVETEACTSTRCQDGCGVCVLQVKGICSTVGAQGQAKLLIANRGEISRRVIRSAKSLGVPTVGVFTEPDALSLHVTDGDESVCLGASPKEYTNADKLLEVMKSTK